MPKYFISYRQSDRMWSEWIAWYLEGDGESECYLQAWDFHPGANFVVEMDRAIKESERTIIVLSPSYLEGAFTRPEWTAAFSDDPDGAKRRLVPVRVAECEPRGLLKNIVYIDLVGVLDEQQAVSRLLGGLKPKRPRDKPQWPPEAAPATITPYFPNDPASRILEKYREIITHEFETATQRLRNPDPSSNTCTLLFGMNFPFGTDRAVQEVSRCAVLYDVREFLSATVGKFHAPGSQWTDSFIPHIVYKAASTRWRILVAAVGAGLPASKESILFLPLLRGLQAWKDVTPIPEKLSKIATAYAYGKPDARDFNVLEDLLFYLGAACGNHGVRIEDLLAEEQKNYRHVGRRPREDRHEREFVHIKEVQIYFRDQPGSYESLLKALAIHKINIFSSSSWTLLVGRVACSRLKVSLPPDLSDEQLHSVFEQPLKEGAVYRFELVND
jgi:TIR domain